MHLPNREHNIMRIDIPRPKVNISKIIIINLLYNVKFLILDLKCINNLWSHMHSNQRRSSVNPCTINDAHYSYETYWIFKKGFPLCKTTSCYPPSLFQHVSSSAIIIILTTRWLPTKLSQRLSFKLTSGISSSSLSYTSSKPGTQYNANRHS